jgi:hypothetical protein
MVGVPTRRLRRQATWVRVGDPFPSPDEVIGERIAFWLTEEAVAYVCEESSQPASMSREHLDDGLGRQGRRTPRCGPGRRVANDQEVDITRMGAGRTGALHPARAATLAVDATSAAGDPRPLARSRATLLTGEQKVCRARPHGYVVPDCVSPIGSHPVRELPGVPRTTSIPRRMDACDCLRSSTVSCSIPCQLLSKSGEPCGADLLEQITYLS